MGEIKEISEQKRKEDDVLLAIAAGNRRPILPNLEFEYPDPEIQEDLYQLIKYSCGEVCSTEQLDKVMKIWTTFLEPMLGVPSRLRVPKDTEDAVEAKKDSAKTGTASIAKGDSSPGVGATVMSPKNTFEQSNSCKEWQTNGVGGVKEDDCLKSDRSVPKTETLGSSTLQGNVHINASIPDEVSRVNKQDHSIEQLVNANVSMSSRVEQSNGRTNINNASGWELDAYCTIYLVHGHLFRIIIKVLLVNMLSIVRNQNI